MEEESGQPGGEAAGWENPLALGLMEREETAVLCRLFADLLEFYDLEYSLNVLRNEVNDRGEKDVSGALRRLGIDSSDRAQPLILQLLGPKAIEQREERKPQLATPGRSHRAPPPEAHDDEDENDIFLKESCAMDLSVESGVDEQFDYVEDAELIL